MSWTKVESFECPYCHEWLGDICDEAIGGEGCDDFYWDGDCPGCGAQVSMEVEVERKVTVRVKAD